MRVIKFRAWDKDKQTWLSPEELMNKAMWGTGEENAGQLYYSPTYLELMQFTGLLDKNGTEIYEGDIVQTWREYTYPGKSSKPRVVKWRSGFNWTGFNIGLGKFSNRSDRLLRTEVIGNIYENPELIK